MDNILLLKIEKLYNGYVVELDGDKRIITEDDWVKEYVFNAVERLIKKEA